MTKNTIKHWLIIRQNIEVRGMREKLRQIKGCEAGLKGERGGYKDSGYRSKSH